MAQVRDQNHSETAFDEGGEGIWIPPRLQRNHPDLPLNINFAVGADSCIDDLYQLSRPNWAATARWLIEAAWRAHLAGQRGVSYSRRKNWYADARRRGLQHTYVRVLGVLDELTDQNIIENHKAPPQWERGPAALQSYFALTPATRIAISAQGGIGASLKAVLGDLVRLRDRRTGDLLDPGRGPTIHDLERRMTAINEAVAAAAWTPDAADVVETRGDLLVVRTGDGRPVYLNNGGGGFVQLLSSGHGVRDWTGGRMFGWAIQNAPRAVRRRGRISNLPIAEVDFCQLHPRLILGRASVQPARGADLYAPVVGASGETRDLVKQAVNIGLNATTARAARGALALEMAQDGKMPSRAEHARAAALFAEVDRIDPALSAAMGKDQGVKLMRLESEILRSAAAQLIKRGIPFAPLHDAVAVSEGDANIAAEIMERAAHETVGFELPVSIRLPPK